MGGGTTTIKKNRRRAKMRGTRLVREKRERAKEKKWDEGDKEKVTNARWSLEKST